MSTRCPAHVKRTLIIRRRSVPAARYGLLSLVPAVVHRLSLGRRRLARRLPDVDDVPADVEAELDLPPGREVRSGELPCLLLRRSRSRPARRSPRRGSRARRRAPFVRSDRSAPSRPRAASRGAGTSRSARAPSARDGRSDRRATPQSAPRRGRRPTANATLTYRHSSAGRGSVTADPPRGGTGRRRARAPPEPPGRRPRSAETASAARRRRSRSRPPRRAPR